MANTVMQSGRNGGRLKVGNPGNRGGGRIKESLRVELVQCFETGVEKLRQRMYHQSTTTGELVRLVDFMGKYAFPYLHEPEEPEEDVLEWIEGASIEELRDWARKDAKGQPTVIVIDHTKEARLTDDERADRISELLSRANDRRQGQGE